jgi:hypothetical protein
MTVLKRDMAEYINRCIDAAEQEAGEAKAKE